MPERIWHLKIEAEGSTKDITLKKEDFVVGRSEEADVKLDGRSVSRRHIHIFFDGAAGSDVVWIEDLSSANGTFLNEEKIPRGGRVRYQLGQRVRIGTGQEYVTVIKLEDPPRPRTSVTILPDINADKTMADASFGQVMEAAKKEADAVISHARQEGQKIIEEARKEAQMVKDKLDGELKLAAEKFQRQVERETKDRAEALMNEARLGASHVKLKAQDEAAKIIEDANRQVFELKTKTQKDTAQILLESQTRAQTIYKNAEEEAEKTLEQAKVRSQQMQAEAQKLADEMRTRAFQESESMLQDQQKNWEKARSQMKQELEQSMEDRSKAMYEQAQAQAQRYKDETTKFEAKLQHLRVEVEGFQKNYDTLCSQDLSMKSAIEQLKREEATLRNHVASYFGRISVQVASDIDGLVKSKKNVTLDQMREVVESNLKSQIKEDIETVVASMPSAVKGRGKTFWFASAAIGLIMGVIGYLFVGPAIGAPKQPLSLLDEWKKENPQPTLNLQTSPDFKSSYTDNVLYTKGYVDFKDNASLQRTWIHKLNELFAKQNLKENAVVDFVRAETDLLSDLKDIKSKMRPDNKDAEIQAMRDRETGADAEMKKIVGAGGFAKVQEIEKNFFENIGPKPASVPPSSAPSSTTSEQNN